MHAVACCIMESGVRCPNEALRTAWVMTVGWVPVCEQHIAALYLPVKSDVGGGV